jgi:hypothetical protein
MSCVPDKPQDAAAVHCGRRETDEDRSISRLCRRERRDKREDRDERPSHAARSVLPACVTQSSGMSPEERQSRRIGAMDELREWNYSDEDDARASRNRGSVRDDRG